MVSEASREGRFCVPLSFDFLLDHIPSNGELTFRISAMQAQYRKCKACENAWAKATNISVYLVKTDNQDLVANHKAR